MKPSHFRWSIILLLFVVNIVNYMDRSAIAYAAHQIQHEFVLSDARIGLVLGAFGFGYACTTFLGGFIADRYGARITFAVAAVLWSLSAGSTGLATGFAMLYAARMALGLAEGPSFPTHARIVERWLPPQERATAIAGALAAIPIALALGAPAAAYLIKATGWRVMFFILAALGLLWVPFWLHLARNAPKESPNVNAAELALITRGRDRDAKSTHGGTDHETDWKVLLTTPTLLASYWASLFSAICSSSSSPGCRNFFAGRMILISHKSAGRQRRPGWPLFSRSCWGDIGPTGFCGPRADCALPAATFSPDRSWSRPSLSYHSPSSTRCRSLWPASPLRSPPPSAPILFSTP